MRTSEGTTIWYLRVIHHLAQTSDVWTLDISGEEWGEVDFPPDVEAAQSLCERWDNQLISIARRRERLTEPSASAPSASGLENDPDTYRSPGARKSRH